MQSKGTLTVGLAVLCAFQAGLLLAPVLGGTARAQTPSDATADEPAPESRAPRTAAPGQLLCRIFKVSLGRDDVLETADRTSEVGQWLGDRADEGWELSHIDFEVGQKPTGYPEGHLQVCVQPS